MRLTVGGDWIKYPYNISTPTVDMITVKLLFNLMISTESAKFMLVDIKIFYLNTPMQRFEYMQLRYNVIPKQLIEQYELDKIKTNERWVYV